MKYCCMNIEKTLLLHRVCITKRSTEIYSFWQFERFDFQKFDDVQRLKDFRQDVGNKAKVRISKRVFQENKGRQIFRKTNISYSLMRISHPLICFFETLILRFALLPYHRRNSILGLFEL